jgi:hypothetical protein
MGAFANGARGIAAAESPELVLIDDCLAHSARSRLVVPEETLARLVRENSLRRLVAHEATGSEDVSDDATPSWYPLPQAARVARRKPKLLAAGATTGALIAALLLGVQVDLRGTPAGADSIAPQTPTTLGPPRSKAAGQTRLPKAEKPGRPTSRPSPAAPELGPRRFAWAPVSGASGYHVEFFRGDSLVYSSDTTSPQLKLPSSWTLDGRAHRLSAGAYRWNVWPVVSGLRQAKATVQAELVVR